MFSSIPMGAQLVYARMSIDEFKRQTTALRDNLLTIEKNTAQLIHLPLSEEVFIWAITDKHPPVKSGFVYTKNDLLGIARQHGIKVFADQYYIDQFEAIVRWDFPLISHIRRQDGKHSVAVWGNHLQYLCSFDPALLWETIDDDELLFVKLIFGEGDWSGSYNGGYIRNFIRRREAKRKLGGTKAECGENPIFVEFLYSPENTWYIPRNRWAWRRHRIVKKTNKTIFVEEMAYQGTSYLTTGWQAFIVYTVMIDRAELEENQYFHHHSRRKTYYTKPGAPELKNRKFLDGNDLFQFYDWLDDSDYVETDDVIEIPANEHQWAMATLGIAQWPISRDEIRRIYKIMAQKMHPDKTGGDHGPMAAINIALSILLKSL